MVIFQNKNKEEEEKVNLNVKSVKQIRATEKQIDNICEEFKEKEYSAQDAAKELIKKIESLFAEQVSSSTEIQQNQPTSLPESSEENELNKNKRIIELEKENMEQEKRI